MIGGFFLSHAGAEPGIQFRVGTFWSQNLMNLIVKKEMPEADIHCLYKIKSNKE